MPISSPPQTLPQVAVRDDLDVMVRALDFWGHLGTDSPFYFSGGGTESFGGDSTHPIYIGLPTSSTVPQIAYASTPLVLSWFDYFAVEFEFFVPDFADTGPGTFGIGFASAPSVCAPNSTAMLRFSRGGTTCTGTVNPGFWNVINGPVSNSVVFNTGVPFSINTWYRAKIEYTKSPNEMVYYINDEVLIPAGIIFPVNIPDDVSLSFRMIGSLTVDASPVNFLINWVRFTGELTTTPREV